jgi:hypothetical protein
MIQGHGPGKQFELKPSRLASFASCCMCSAAGKQQQSLVLCHMLILVTAAAFMRPAWLTSDSLNLTAQAWQMACAQHTGINMQQAHSGSRKG